MVSARRVHHAPHRRRSQRQKSMKTDQDIAKALLQNRVEGVSICRFIGSSSRRYLLMILAALALLAGAVYEDAMFLKFLLTAGFGLYCGALLRDTGWIRRMKKDWAFTSRIIDWPKVEAMAEGNESANKQIQPIAGKPGSG